MQEINPLSKYAKNVTSQHGEDGIIEHICKVLGISRGWSVELGAGDGVWLSNTHQLLKDKKWSGVMIEVCSSAFEKLNHTYRGCQNVYLFNEEANFDGPSNLNDILGKTPIPKEFDLFSLDINGNDYHLWEAFDYTPKVAVIEYNPSIPNEVHFVQKKDMRIQHGSSLAALIALGKKKDYELIATTRTNAFFVQRDLFPLFGIKDNRIQAMRESDSALQTYLFQLYDGTFCIKGNRGLIWTATKKRTKIRSPQIFPRWLRNRNSGGLLKKILRKIWLFVC